MLSSALKCLEMSKKHKTPYLAFDISKIESNLVQLAKIGKKHKVQFNFAVKSFPSAQILSLASQIMDGFDVSNLNEWNLIKKYGLKSSMMNPLLDEQTIRKVISPKSVFVANSLRQLEMLAKYGARFFIRMETTKFDTSSFNSRFGLDLHNLSVEVSSWTKLPGFEGFHFHFGFQNNEVKAFVRLVDWLLKFKKKHGLEIPTLNVGGFSYLSMGEVDRLLGQIRQKLPSSMKVECEPGRVVISQAGFAVGSIKDSSGYDTTKKISDLSRLVHLQWSNFNVIDWGSMGNQDSKIQIDVGGPTCSEHDFIAKMPGTAMIEVKGASEKKIILSGISGYSLGHNHGFNGIRPAKVIFFKSRG